jgi:hypothetical protein
MFNKIKNDSFRTLATDHQFRSKVGEERLVRCLEAFVWRQLGERRNLHGNFPVSLNGLLTIDCSLMGFTDLAAYRTVEPDLPPPTIDPGTPYVQGEFPVSSSGLEPSRIS